MRRNYVSIVKNYEYLFLAKFICMSDVKVFDRLTPLFQQPCQMIEIELDQIGFMEGRPKLYSSLLSNNLGSYTVSDISSDETV